MNEITKRFVDTYKEMGLTGYRMGKDTQSITKQKISNIEKGITEVTAEILSDFSSVYEVVNANYILTGRGPMFLTPDLLQNESEQSIDALERMSNELERLRKENERLKQQLKKKESA